MKIFNKVVGNKGEIMAQNYLKSLGYKIIATNFSCKMGEIDIIAQDKKTLVFVEVKTKTSSQLGFPREMVNLHKQNKIRQVAQYYLLKNKLTNCDCRCDVVEILEDRVAHLKGCF